MRYINLDRPVNLLVHRAYRYLPTYLPTYINNKTSTLTFGQAEGLDENAGETNKLLG